MSDPFSPHIKARDTPSWGLYQRDQFWKANDGLVPPFNTREFCLFRPGKISEAKPDTDPDELEKLAKEKLSQNGW
jgi:hypothetical protein